MFSRRGFLKRSANVLASTVLARLAFAGKPAELKTEPPPDWPHVLFANETVANCCIEVGPPIGVIMGVANQVLRPGDAVYFNPDGYIVKATYLDR